MVTNLPSGAIHYPWHGGDYWHSGYGWYTACWVAGSLCYAWAYPPAGYYYPSLPDDYSTVVINNETYYESDGVYYQPGEQDGQAGYVVAEAPVPPAAPEEAGGGEGEDPFVIFKAMCDFVASQQKFRVVAQTTVDKLNESGDKVQLSARRIMQVSRPNMFAINVTGDQGVRKFVYDGKTIGLYDGTAKITSVIETPETIDATLDALARDYGAVVPFEDLMYSDLYARMEAIVTAAQYVGLHTIGRASCHHLAFATDAANCEVWIDARDKPVPRRITIDYTQDASRTRYAADIVEWNASPEFATDTFTFSPPADARQVRIAPNRKDN